MSIIRYHSGIDNNIISMEEGRKMMMQEEEIFVYMGGEQVMPEDVQTCQNPSLRQNYSC